MSIQLCNYTLIMQLQSYVHSYKQYIIHCMQWHFCRCQQLQFWSLDQMRVMGSELPVRPCTQWWDCWSMASRRGYCNDAFHRGVVMFIGIFWFHFFADFYITISQMEGELPRGKVLNTGTCKLVQWTLARHEGDCKWGYLWWDASTVDAGRR